MRSIEKEGGVGTGVGGRLVLEASICKKIDNQRTWVTEEFIRKWR